MKKVMAAAIVFAFVLVTGIAFAGGGETESAGAKAKGGPALNNMANWMLSHFPKHENSAAKEAAAPLSKEELKMQRENTGMGMRGRVGN